MWLRELAGCLKKYKFSPSAILRFCSCLQTSWNTAEKNKTLSKVVLVYPKFGHAKQNFRITCGRCFDLDFFFVFANKIQHRAWMNHLLIKQQPKHLFGWICGKCVYIWKHSISMFRRRINFKSWKGEKGYIVKVAI